MNHHLNICEESSSLFIDNIVDEMGNKIEAIHPFLELLKGKKENTPEYKLLDKIWVDWCDYLETDS